MGKLVDELIGYLVSKKQNLNEEIDEIIYDDLNKGLVVEDIMQIDKKRKQIKQCYDMVEYLENAVKVFMEEK